MANTDKTNTGGNDNKRDDQPAVKPKSKAYLVKNSRNYPVAVSIGKEEIRWNIAESKKVGEDVIRHPRFVELMENFSISEAKQ